MENKFAKHRLYVALLCTVLLFLIIMTATADGGTATRIDFPVNDAGQTYGSGLHPDFELIVKPDLILAIGVDGTEGYVLRTDLEGTGPLQRPQNAEEALVYNEQLMELAREAQARGDKYVYYIPLYASDGCTIIGEFGITY